MNGVGGGDLVRHPAISVVLLFIFKKGPNKV